MTTLARILGRPPEQLPDDLSTLTERQMSRALEEREERIRTLAEQGRKASREERKAALAELRAATEDVRRLREAAPTARPEPRPPEYSYEEAARANRRQVIQEEPTMAAKALAALIRDFALPAELAGVRLDPDRLDEDEGAELMQLTKRAFGTAEPTLDEAARERLEQLFDKAAGEPVWKNLHIEREVLAFAEETRRRTLPKREVYAEPGSVTIPAAAFDAMRSGTGEQRGATAPDLAALAVIVNALDLRDPALIQGGRIEEDEQTGEPVLVVKAAVRLAIRANPPMDAMPDVGRVRPDIDGLARWLDVRRRGNVVEIRRGSMLP